MSNGRNYRVDLRRKKIVWLFVAAVGVIIISALVGAALKSNKYEYVNELLRPKDGQGQKMYELEIEHGGTSDNVVVYVDAKKLTKEELDEIFGEAKKILDLQLLGTNTNMDFVTEPLNLVSTLSEYNMQVDWFIDDVEVIDYWGDIHQQSESRSVTITATLTYEGRIMEGLEASREYSYELIVQPYNKEQLRGIAIDKMLDEADNDSGDMDRIILPKEYEGKQLKYRMKSENSLVKLVLIVPVILVILIVELRSKEEKKKKKLREQLIMEYPEIISKLSLLVSSGMTPYNALDRIAADGDGEAYKRLSSVIKNIQSGASQRSQYASFGQIFGVYCYSRLGSMLEQNVVKGNERLRAMLRQECAQALEERKARARKAGEQAGTKMLFPMMLMLVVVMIVIMVPAFMSM